MSTTPGTEATAHRGGARDACDLRVLSYNLREHRAVGEIRGLVERYHLDVLCLQECDTPRMPTEIGGLTRAGMTSRNRLGLALYYRADRFELQAATTYALSKSLHDHVLSPAHERLLAAHLRDTEQGTDLLVASFHASPLSAGNSIRRKQIRTALETMRSVSPTAPMLMVGDYNYPWFQRGLQRAMTEAGYLVSRSDLPTYRVKVFRGHFDFGVSDAMRIDRVSTLPQGESDHLPVLFEANYGGPHTVGANPASS